jgi:hypothetical protein
LAPAGEEPQERPQVGHNMLETGSIATRRKAANEALQLALPHCLKAIAVVIVSDEPQELPCRRSMVVECRGRQPPTVIKMSAVGFDQHLRGTERAGRKRPVLFQVADK